LRRKKRHVKKFLVLPKAVAVSPCPNERFLKSDGRRGMRMLSLEGLIGVLSLCVGCFAVAYTPGSHKTQKQTPLPQDRDYFCKQHLGLNRCCIRVAPCTFVLTQSRSNVKFWRYTTPNGVSTIRIDSPFFLILYRLLGKKIMLPTIKVESIL